MSTIQPPLPPELPDRPEQSANLSNSPLLEELAALTGLFDPGQIVEELEQLEELDNGETRAPSPDESQTSGLAPR